MEKEGNKYFNCRSCNIDKSISDYYKDKSRKRGHHPYCRPCQNKIKYRNKQKCIDRATKWNKDNPKRRKQIRLKWYKNNPELIRIYRHKRRIREFNLSDGSITKNSLKKLPKENCAICNNKLNWEIKGLVHLDHIKPLVRGGAHSIKNVQWTCSTCNLKKGSK